MENSFGKIRGRGVDYLLYCLVDIIADSYYNVFEILEKCEMRFNEWCIQNNFSLKKIRILTGLIYLNIAPLHHRRYSLFLYALGKSMLKKELIKKV